jgi:hypothetical protein
LVELGDKQGARQAFREALKYAPDEKMIRDQLRQLEDDSAPAPADGSP